VVSSPKVKSNGIDEKTKASYIQLERTRLQLQRQANRSQQKEMGLLRRQIDAQTGAYNDQLGFMRQQAEQSQVAATQAQSVMDVQAAENEKQKQLAADEARRTQMDEGIQRSNVAATQLKLLRTYRQRSTIQRGFLSAYR
jgi:hypothetical protein